MAKEIERAGIPTALVTAMVPVAQSVGAPRIVAAPAIVHPLGNPRLPIDQERGPRGGGVGPALGGGSTPPGNPPIFPFSPDEAADGTGVPVGERFLH